VLQQIAACRGAVNGLLVEIVEGEIMFRVLSKDAKARSRETKAVESLLQILHRYIK
jgi:DNA-binding FrmR family transcriptional regulator